tara:strand:- start:656 stop:1492 length:837 start_codon:yes stop_codon:yes gene_type:complete
MARTAPTPSQKISFILLILTSSLILYLDLTSNNFQNIKNGFKAFKISSFYIAKEISIEPIKSIINITKSKDDLVEENKNLKSALELSHLNNYLISKENIFYRDEEIIKNVHDKADYKFAYDVANLKSIDPNIFMCCDKHRMFIEIKGNNDASYIESVVFNSEGILGQIINESKFYEVLLLTDISHSLPIKLESNKFYCNAKGSGRAEYIICNYNPLIWTEVIDKSQAVYTSGLGGVYPKDVEIGYVSSIINTDSKETRIEIKLLANPLNGNQFGVLNY